MLLVPGPTGLLLLLCCCCRGRGHLGASEHADVGPEVLLRLPPVLLDAEVVDERRAAGVDQDVGHVREVVLHADM